MKIRTLVLLIALFLANPAHAAKENIFSGKEKGYAVDGGYTFFNEKGKPILIIKGLVFDVWRGSQELGSCMLSEPIWYTTRNGIPSKVYRFAYGFLFEERDSVTLILKPEAQKWWEKSGLHRVKKK